MNKGEKTSGHNGQPPSENHTMPDEIWAQWMPADVGCGEWDKVSLGDDVPYTRTDIHEKVKAERDELLEVLEYAVDIYGQTGGPWNVPGSQGAWITQARNAISKIKGTGDDK